MTSRLLSQIFNQNSASIYETLREQDAATDTDSDLDDLEERAGMAPIVRNPRSGGGGEPGDSDLDDGSTFQLRHRPPMAESTAERHPHFFTARSGDSKYMPAPYQDEEDDTEVPQSLLYETAGSPSQPPQRADYMDGEESVLGPGASISGDPGPSTMRNRRLEEQWNAATAREDYRHRTSRPNTIGRARLGFIDPKEKAMWKWANVHNLDNFLQDVCLPPAPCSAIGKSHRL